jgi:hypothetical protein
MRWTLMAPQDERCCKRTAKSWRPDTPTLVSSLPVTAGRRRWQQSPAHRGDHEGNRNTIAQGMPECFGQPVVTMLVCFHFLHTRLRVRPKHPAFPAPSLIQGRRCGRTRARFSSVAGTRRRVIESANAVMLEQGKPSCLALIRLDPARSSFRQRASLPGKMDARVKRAYDPPVSLRASTKQPGFFAIPQGDAASLHLGQLQIGHKGEFQFFGSRGRRIC